MAGRDEGATGEDKRRRERVRDREDREGGRGLLQHGEAEREGATQRSRKRAEG